MVTGSDLQVDRCVKGVNVLAKEIIQKTQTESEAEEERDCSITMM